MKKLFTIFAIIFCGIWATTTSKAELTDFYTYTDNGAGYKVSLTENFRAQLDKASGGELISDDYTWRTGDALPNPAPDGMYNGVPVVSMEKMFAYCKSLSSLDLSHFNTSKVTDMGYMFYDCLELSSLDLSSFNTKNVTDMRSMFFGCDSLPSLDLSSFNTSKVTDMGYMFAFCKSLPSLDLSSFNTSKVTNMISMFSNCYSLSSLDLSSFNTSNVTDMSAMFNSCVKLKNLDLSSFNTSNVMDMNYMFCACNALPSLDLSNFNTAKVENMSGMFSNCYSLSSLDLSSFNTSNVTNISSMFYECGKITNGQPAVGYAKDAATAAIFNDGSKTGIDLSRLEFRVKTSGIVSENNTKTLQLRGNVLYNPTGSEVVVYTVSGQRILVSSDINIDLSSFANAAYVAQSETETIKIAL